MNPHLPAIPHPSPGMPPHPPRRQHDHPFTPSPQGYRPPQYIGYRYPHMSPYPPTQAPHQYYNWSGYQQMQGPPPGQYQPYTPLVVSSYPPQTALPSAHRPPQPLPPPTPVSNPSPVPSPIPPPEQQSIPDVRDGQDALQARNMEDTEKQPLPSEELRTAPSNIQKGASIQGDFEPYFRPPVSHFVFICLV
jgi:hypothetical protein